VKDAPSTGASGRRSKKKERPEPKPPEGPQPTGRPIGYPHPTASAVGSATPPVSVPAPRGLRHYEVMVILDPDLEDRTITPSLERFLTVVTNTGGSVGKVDVWGRRRLAYEIRKNVEGIYAVIDVNAAPAAITELDRQLKLSESILRTKVIRPELH
jgi:small subunit ribosomal protein S6